MTEFIAVVLALWLLSLPWMLLSRWLFEQRLKAFERSRAKRLRENESELRRLEEIEQICDFEQEN